MCTARSGRCTIPPRWRSFGRPRMISSKLSSKGLLKSKRHWDPIAICRVILRHKAVLIL